MKHIITKLYTLVSGSYYNIMAYIFPKKVGELAFRTFTKVRKGRVSKMQKPFLDPAKKAINTIAEHQIQTYHWQGSGPTVLLVHGWESNTWRWHKLIVKLQAADYNIIAFDAPGHGYSSGQNLHVPLYAKILQKIIKEHHPLHLVGHSVGGMTILFNEYFEPSTGVEKIVTIGSPAEFEAILEHYKKLLGLNKKVMDGLNTYVLKHFGLQTETVSTIAYVKTNTKKGLLFHDRLDTIAPYSASERVHVAWQGSRLISTEGLGHSMHQDEVNDQLVAFLSPTEK